VIAGRLDHSGNARRIIFSSDSGIPRLRCRLDGGTHEHSPQERAEAIGDQLRAKIGGKVQSATFLAGFTISLLGIEITALWQSNVPLSIPAALSILVFALVLFIRAILQLDGLTMPKRFWPEDPALPTDTGRSFAYLTDDNLWAIQKRMVFLWPRLVVVGLYISVISLLTMLVSISRPSSASVIAASLALSLAGLIAAVIYVKLRVNEDKQGFEPLARGPD
jgi:hypothetical protein